MRLISRAGVESGKDSMPKWSRNAMPAFAGAVWSAAALLICCVVLPGCRESGFRSLWCEQPIIVDGQNTDWPKASLYEKSSETLGLLNDDRRLYVLLKLADRQGSARVMRQGLTVWFDQFGRKARTFGIRFPLGRHGLGMPEGRGQRDDMRREPGEGRDRRAPGDDFGKMFDSLHNEMEIIGPGGDESRRITIGAAEAMGIKVRLGRSGKGLVYELELPLLESKDCPFAVTFGWPTIDTSRVISIGFESAMPDAGDDKGGLSFGNGPEGGGPEGGDPIGGGGMFPGGRRMAEPGGMSGSLKWWTNFKLAAPSTRDTSRK